MLYASRASASLLNITTFVARVGTEIVLFAAPGWPVLAHPSTLSFVCNFKSPATPAAKTGQTVGACHFRFSEMQVGRYWRSKAGARCCSLLSGLALVGRRCAAIVLKLINLHNVFLPHAGGVARRAECQVNQRQHAPCNKFLIHPFAGFYCQQLLRGFRAPT